MTSRVDPNIVYTVETNEPAKDGSGKPRRYYKNGDKLIASLPDINNLHQNFLHGVSVSGNDRYLGTRTVTNGTVGPYVWQTYNEVLTRVKNFGSGLVDLGLIKDANIGLFSMNRAEWVIGEQACYAYSLVTVPLYDTLGSEAVTFITNQAELTTIIATKDKAKLLVEIHASIPVLKTVIVMDGADEALLTAAKSTSLQIIDFVAVEKKGSEKPAPIVPTTLESIATICYTSGTTGQPKGVLLSHGNFLSVAASAVIWGQNGSLTRYAKDDSHLSYLPLAHVFERIIQTVFAYVGGSVGFYQGDTLKIIDDLQELKPTVFASVPRLYNRIYDKIMAGALNAGGIKTALFKFAYAAKKKHLANGHITHSIWDRVVFSKVRERLGGRVRVMITGAAPISGDVIDFLRICFSAEIMEGYGQTETASASCVTVLEDITSGHLGVPMGQCEIKLIDVPSMNYFSTDKPCPRGEILIRGHNVFKGYYKDPVKTAETLDEEGWCHTGDVGMWDTQGRLKIIDRVKNIFKLAQGEYIAPEKIEMVYCKHETVAQMFVYGDSLQATVVAIVVPDEEMFKKWALAKSFNYTSLADACKNDEIRKALKKELESYAKESDLKGFEVVKNIALEPVPFSVENNLLTPTFKLKRHELKLTYKTQIDAMYAELSK